MADYFSLLARLTLRQLRNMASDLGIRLSIRKSKPQLIESIRQHQNDQASVAAEAAVDHIEGVAEDVKRPEVPASTQVSVPQAEPSAVPDQQPAADDESTGTNRVVFLPRDPQWAYVFWEIADHSRDAAKAAGAQQLCLRISDVTGLKDGNSHPHALQELPVDESATEWYVPMPLSDRDYRVELGYRLEDFGWFSLACSATARVPAIEPSEQVLDQFVPFSLDATPMPLPTPVEGPVDSNLHEVLYQAATRGFHSTHPRGGGSEGFQQRRERAEVAGVTGLSDSAVGIWASGRSASGIGMAARQRSFWLVADAELIVYGATDPAASLTIGQEPVPLTPEGTFRIQVPFRDGSQEYAIKAVAADGEQQRNIMLKFERKTPEDNTNTPAQATNEWF